MKVTIGISAGTAAAASCSSRRGPNTVPASSQVADTVISSSGIDHSRIAVTRANRSPPEASQYGGSSQR